MPAINPRALVEAISDAIQQSGYSAVLTSPIRQHPRRFIVTSPDGDSRSLWVYVWTLTFGGRPNLPHEYRIQMTTVSSPLPVNPSGLTLLLGYEPSLRVFAGFDLRRHGTFTTGSPSVQIDIRQARDALQHGLTFDRKSNQEIAIGIRPDQLVNYALNAEHLHLYGRQPETFRLLGRAAAMETITAAEIAGLPEARRRIVQSISRLSRSANFRQQVLNAYGNRCAVTRVQLRLVDAAHILPVGSPNSSDHVTNGIALSPTYHRAFDNGLIYLDDTHVMRLNTFKLTDLASLRLDGGVGAFKEPLEKILLPQDRSQWPRPEYIRRANTFRLIQSNSAQGV
jgi:putative restriction endonuclease